jgi:hypothetical protein
VAVDEAVAVALVAVVVDSMQLVPRRTAQLQLSLEQRFHLISFGLWW